MCLWVIVIYSVRKCDESRLHTERTYSVHFLNEMELSKFSHLPPCIDRISHSHPNNSARRVRSRAFFRQLRQGDQTLQPPLGPLADRKIGPAWNLQPACTQIRHAPLHITRRTNRAHSSGLDPMCGSGLSWIGSYMILPRRDRTPVAMR